MKWSKLTALFLLFSSFVFIACEEEDHLVPAEYSGTLLPMSGTQEVPAVTTGASGSIQATYSQYTKTLNYTITWTGLSGNATSAHLHGTGEAGVSAELTGLLQALPSFPASASKSYSGSVLIDGVKLLEQHLLAGKYYINIHTAAYPGSQANPRGELRGQVLLTKL